MKASHGSEETQSEGASHDIECNHWRKAGHPEKEAHLLEASY